MKKTVIALTAVSAVVAFAVQAAPQTNTFYTGARAGWASFHNDINSLRDAGEWQRKIRKNSVAYGIFAGYQLTDHFAIEAGYDHYGTLKMENNTPDVKSDKLTNHGANLSLKASYPVLDNLDIYARAGAALVRTDYSGYNNQDAHKEHSFHSLKVSPLVAGGLEYAIPGLESLAVRLEYQWLHKVGRDQQWFNWNEMSVTPSIGSVTLGVSYRFGQGSAPAPAAVESKVFNLSSDVLFASNKYNLKPEAAQTLDNVSSEIAKVSNPSVKVAGYADRMGSDAYNLKLSQRRAETVANYLVAKGNLDSNKVSATGYGEANPVTGNQCDGVKGRKALIACLAPDRRVEVAVSGSK